MGNPLMAAAACAVVEEITKPGFLTRVMEAGNYLAIQLDALSRRHGCGSVRGRGLLRALDLGFDGAPQVVELARQRCLLINAPRPDSLRFMPALTVTDPEIDHMIGVLDAVLDELMPA